MLLVAAMEATERLQWRYRGVWRHALLAATVATGSMMSLVLFAVVKPAPFYEPQVWIPVQGMVLGNSISAVSLGLASLLSEAGNHGDRIELALGFGASRFEAASPAIRTALLTAMMPSLNQMAVAGLIFGAAVGGTVVGVFMSATGDDEALARPPRPDRNGG